MYQPLQSASSLPSEQSATPLHLASDLTHWPLLQANKPSGQDGGNVPKWKKTPSFINLFKTYSYSCGRKNMFILRFVFDILTLKVLQKHDMFHHIGVENSPTLFSFHQRKPLFSINKLRTLLIIQLLYSFFFIPKNLFSLRLLQKKTLVAKPFTCI